MVNPSQALSPPVLPITAPRPLVNEHELVHALFAAGCSILHLRKPGQDFASLQQWMGCLAPDFHRRVTLHGPVEWAQQLGCGGVHHPQSRRGDDLRSSQSWHTLDAPHAGCDYGFLSPIWASTSKFGYGPRWKTSELIEHSRQWPKGSRVYALGGVTPQRCQQAHGWGFCGVAVLGWLWGDGGQTSAQVVKNWQSLNAAWAAVVPE